MCSSEIHYFGKTCFPVVAACVLMLFILVLSFFGFPALALAFQLFTRKHYLQISGLRMRNFT